MAAFFISHALIKTGMARRIALVFIRTVGKTPLGVCYALSCTDLVLAAVIPSNGARFGRGSTADPAIHRGTLWLVSRPDRRAHRIVPHDGSLSGDLHLSRYVHDRPGQQPPSSQMATEVFHYQ